MLKPSHEVEKHYCQFSNVVITTDVAKLGINAIKTAIKAIATFDDFLNLYFPDENHDTGSIDIEGKAVFFKVDRYEIFLPGDNSSDRPQRANAKRLISLFLAEEL